MPIDREVFCPNNLKIYSPIGMILEMPLLGKYYFNKSPIIMQLKNLLPVLTLFTMISEPIFARDADRPEIKYSNKRFEVKVPEKKVKTLVVEIRDMHDKLVYGTKYYNVSDFEKIYSVSQLPKGKYFVKIVSDGNIYQDVIKVKRRSM